MSKLAVRLVSLQRPLALAGGGIIRHDKCFGPCTPFGVFCAVLFERTTGVHRWTNALVVPTTSKNLVQRIAGL